jgi:hypothetical protein
LARFTRSISAFSICIGPSPEKRKTCQAILQVLNVLGNNCMIRNYAAAQRVNGRRKESES